MFRMGGRCIAKTRQLIEKGIYERYKGYKLWLPCWLSLQLMFRCTVFRMILFVNPVKCSYQCRVSIFISLYIGLIKVIMLWNFFCALHSNVRWQSTIKRKCACFRDIMMLHVIMTWKYFLYNRPFVRGVQSHGGGNAELGCCQSSLLAGDLRHQWHSCDNAVMNNTPSSTVASVCPLLHNASH